MARQHELEPEPEAVEGRMAPAEVRKPARHHSEAARLVVVLDRLRGNVVAEPLRLLVGVGMAADVDQQRRVVNVCALLLVEVEPLGEAQRDQALPQDVLHRLAEAEVDPQRQSCHELGEPRFPHGRTIRIVRDVRGFGQLAPAVVSLPARGPARTTPIYGRIGLN